MSFPAIHRFINKVRGIPSGSKDLVMTSADAKALHGEITKLLLELENSRNTPQKNDNFVDKIEITGGKF